MKKFILPLLALFNITVASAQNTFTAIVRDGLTNEPLIGTTAQLKKTTNGNSADLTGKIEINNIPDGKQIIIFSYIGYEKQELKFSFPLADSLKNISVFMQPEEQEMEELIISTTRTSRTIQNVPTRVETIELEEIEEKANMRPSNVSMILHESTGIQVQQTSPTSGNASIRIQGLDGRYTQLLKDGYPNFGNFASGLSILEIPPLDLKQVEVIKGPVSTLYGGGAIAGVVNFISKTPEETAEYNLIVNQSHIGQTNLGAFASQRRNKFGYTILGTGNLQQPYDVDKDDFTEIPLSTDFGIHPKFFFFPTPTSSLMIGNSFTTGNRTGGDMEVIKYKPDSAHSYFEKNKTLRNIATIEFDKRIKEKDHLNFKSSFSYFNRAISLSDYDFKGENYNSYSDLSFIKTFKNQTLIIGADYIFDHFSEKNTLSFPERDFESNTGGLYAQHTWDISEKIKLESGLRGDVIKYNNLNYARTEFFALPRVSVLFKITDKLNSRIGGGLGYKMPTVFMEQTEAIQYRNVLPLDKITSEKSYGGTADLNFKTPIGEDLFIAINQMFYYTLIDNSTVLQSDTSGNYFFINAEKPVNSMGFETNLKFIYKKNLKLFVGYTFLEAKAKYLSGNQSLPLIAKNRVNLILIFEKEKNFKIGLEAYYTGSQLLNDGLHAPSYWDFGAMAEKTFGKVSLFVNLENLTDSRQSRFKSAVSGPHNNPTFDDIWSSHPEGIVFSGGLKIKM